MSLSSTANLSLSQINKAMRFNTAGNIGIGTTNVNYSYKIYAPSAQIYLGSYLSTNYVNANGGFEAGYGNSTYITTTGTYYIDLSQFSGKTSFLSVTIFPGFATTSGQAWTANALVMQPYVGGYYFRPYLTNINTFQSNTQLIATLAPYGGANTATVNPADNPAYSARVTVSTLVGAGYYIGWQITCLGMAQL